jgi:hypothetical protein
MVTNISWMWCIVQLWKANYPVLSRRLLEQKQQLKWLQVARKRQVIMTYLKVENHHFLIASFTGFLICKIHVKPQVIFVLSWDRWEIVLSDVWMWVRVLFISSLFHICWRFQPDVWSPQFHIHDIFLSSL